MGRLDSSAPWARPVLRKLTLERHETGPQGTFGRLAIPGRVLYTLEREWLDNKPNVSCVPAGTYRCVYSYSPRFGLRLYLLDQVPGRSGIRIHPANLARQLNGCIALGERLGHMDRVKAVLLSVPAVRSLESYMGREPFLLEIKWVSGK